MPDVMFPRDVGLCLRQLDRESIGAASKAQIFGSCGTSSTLPAGRILHCSSIHTRTWEELRRPATVVSLCSASEAAFNDSLADKVKMMYCPTGDRLDAYHTEDEHVRTWLFNAVQQLFEKTTLCFPMLIHCPSGSSWAWVLVAALLSILMVQESRIVKTCLLSDGSSEKNIREALSGLKKFGGIVDYFSPPADAGDGVDLVRVRDLLLACEKKDEVTWLKKDLELLLRSVQVLKGQDESEQQEGARWIWKEAAVLGAELAGLAELTDAPAALCYQGLALAELGKRDDACQTLQLGLALGRRSDAKPQVLKRLQRELHSLGHSEEDSFDLMDVESAADTPGDAHVPLWLLGWDLSGDWRAFPCPDAFSWLQCGELAASASPKPWNLHALDALGLTRIDAEQYGQPDESHWESMVDKVAANMAEGSRVLVHCKTGFGSSCTVLACFIVQHGLDEPVQKKTGQPKMTAGEAIDVLKAMRPGSLSGERDIERLQSFAESAWAKHVEKTQRAFSSGIVAGGADRVPKLAPASARVVRQPGDGNCLFHSLAYGLGSTAAALRSEICTFIEKNPDLSIAGTRLADWIQMLAGSSLQQYAKNMAKSAQWGGAPEIAACAHMRKVNLHVYERRGDRIELSVPFDVAGSTRTVAVLYVGGVHYDALVM